MLTKIKLICLLLFISLPIFASKQVEVKTFFTEEEIKEVTRGKIITRQYIKGDASRENTHPDIPVPRTKYADEDFSIYEMVTDEKAFIPYKLNDNSDRLKFYNTLTAPSKLKGMLYYSRLKQKPRNFIKDSYRIESQKNKKKAADIEFNEIKSEIEGYFLQKDNKFGRLTFRSKLFNEGDNFILINTCLEPLAKMMFKVCDSEENKVITYFIYDAEKEGFFYYTVNVMRIKMDVFLYGNDLIPHLYPTFFSNRLRASTVHLTGLLGVDWMDKLNPWDEAYLKQLRKSKKKKEKNK